MPFNYGSEKKKTANHNQSANQRFIVKTRFMKFHEQILWNKRK